MTSAQIRTAAQLTVSLYKCIAEQENYRKFLMTSVKTQDGVISYDDDRIGDFIREDEAYLTQSNHHIANLRAQIVSLTHGRSREEELAMWQEERRLVGTCLERLREFNSQIVG